MTKAVKTTLLGVTLGLLASACQTDVEFRVREDFATAAFYDPCGSTDECVLAAEACFEIVVDYPDRTVVDGLCTATCFDDFDCPVGGGCFEVQDMEPLCYEFCEFDVDCAPGFACVDAIGAFTIDAICLPF